MTPELLLLDHSTLPAGTGTTAVPVNLLQAPHPAINPTPGPAAVHVGDWEWTQLLVESIDAFTNAFPLGYIAGLMLAEMQWWTAEPTAPAPFTSTSAAALGGLVGRARHGVTGPALANWTYTGPLYDQGWTGLDVCERNRGPWLTVGALLELAGAFRVRVAVGNGPRPRWGSAPAVLANPNPALGIGATGTYILPASWRGQVGVQVNGPAGSGITLSIVDQAGAVIGYVASYVTAANAELRVVELPPGIIRLDIANLSGAPAGIGVAIIPRQPA